MKNTIPKGFLHLKKNIINSLTLTTKQNKISFILKMVLASLICSFALIGDSTPGVLGSILISPLIGSGIGVIIAIITKNLFGFFNSWMFLLIGIVIMFVTGAFIGWFYRKDKLSYEMKRHSSKKIAWANLFSSVIVGIAMAFFILSNNNSILLGAGTALAVSVVPYCVNSGILLTKNIDKVKKKTLIKNNLNIACLHIIGILISCFLIFFLTLHKKIDISI